MDTIQSVQEQLADIERKETNTRIGIESIKVSITRCRARMEGVKTIADEARQHQLATRFATDLNNYLAQLKLTEEKLGRVQNARWWAIRTLDSLKLAAACRKDGTLAHNPFLPLAQGFGPK